MPYQIRKKGGKYQVITKKTGKSHGATTKEKAKKQERLLQAVEHNPNFKPKK